MFLSLTLLLSACGGEKHGEKDLGVPEDLLNEVLQAAEDSLRVQTYRARFEVSLKGDEEPTQGTIAVALPDDWLISRGGTEILQVDGRQFMKVSPPDGPWYAKESAMHALVPLQPSLDLLHDYVAWTSLSNKGKRIREGQPCTLYEARNGPIRRSYCFREDHILAEFTYSDDKVSISIAYFEIDTPVTLAIPETYKE